MDEALEQEREAPLRAGGEAPARAPARARLAAHAPRALCAALLLVLALNLLTAISRKSITNDEIVHIPAGYYHLVDGYFQLNNEHPPLVKMWAAVPLLFVQPDEAPRPASLGGNYSEVTWGYHELFWPKNREQFAAISFWTRASMVPLAVALGALIFAFARRLFGDAAAVLAVALYALEPTVLAHGRVVHTDLPAALAYLLFFFALLRYRERRTLGRALALGLVAGLALVTKFSMVVLLPVLACLGAALLVLAPRLGESRRRLALHAAALALVALTVVNAAYYFTRQPIEPSDVRWVESKSGEAAGRWMAFFRAGSKLVPSYYLFGLYNVRLHNRDGHSTSLLGRHDHRGWWYYFPVAFALKTTLPFLLLSVAALAWSLWGLAARGDRRFLWLLVPFAVYAALSMSSRINIGVRHFLPAYPFLFVAGGALLARLLAARRARAGSVALVLLTLGWAGVEAARAYPDYTPYMNQLAAGRPRWWYLSDSNVEWGDDVRALAEYLKARGETRVRAALSAGWGTLRFYGVEYVDLLAAPTAKQPATRYVAVGASFLNGSTVAFPSAEGGPPVPEGQRINYLEEYRSRTPEAVFGSSIYLYREE